MYGIEQITANNGWAMAAAGACIVLTGLSVLSFIISLFPKIFKLMEPDMPAGAPTEEIVENETLDLGFLLTDDMDVAAKVLAPMASDLGASFDLKDLYITLCELFLITELIDNRLLKRFLSMPREESKQLNRDFIRFVKRDFRIGKKDEEE